MPYVGMKLNLPKKKKEEKRKSKSAHIYHRNLVMVIKHMLQDEPFRWSGLGGVVFSAKSLREQCL